MVAPPVRVPVVSRVEVRRDLAERRARHRVGGVVGRRRARDVVHLARAALREPRGAEGPRRRRLADQTRDLGGPF